MVTSLEEKKGGVHNYKLKNNPLGMYHMHLAKIETLNGVYTWKKHRGGRHQIACRLDKFLILESLLEKYHFLESSILPSVDSNH